MARITTVELVDDLTGEADDTVRTIAISLDGLNYEVDLSGKNLLALIDAMEPFLNVATLIKGQRSKKSHSAAKRGDAKAIRAWAQNHFDGIGNRGRIPKEAIEAFYAQSAA